MELQKLKDFTISYLRIITGDTSQKKKHRIHPMSIDKNDHYIYIYMIVHIITMGIFVVLPEKNPQKKSCGLPEYSWPWLHLPSWPSPQG